MIDYAAVIRAKCLDCCCGSRTMIAQCSISACPLWPYRNGGIERPAPAQISGQVTVYELVAEDEERRAARRKVRAG